MKLIIENVVGYMLKVTKLALPITKYKNEFDAIRHGNYYDFCNLVDGLNIIDIVHYVDGKINTNPSIQIEDCDFVRLFKSGPSLEVFNKKCQLEYGKIVDNDVSDDIYEKAALFEIALRMHANNKKIIKKRDKLIVVIDNLGKHYNLSQPEIDKLHQGRRFINMIKHFKNQFPTWSDGIIAFNEAFEILKKYKFTIV